MSIKDRLGERRTECLKVYLTKQESEDLREAAGSEEMAESEFARVAIKYIINMMRTEEKVTSREQPVPTQDRTA
jgi:hypothetical protein